MRAKKLSGIFISYRREDAAGHAGRLYDRLSAHVGGDKIFIDIDRIQPGENFVEVIRRAISSCDVLLVLIGAKWLTLTDETGHRRLDNPEDFVSLEIAAALQREVRVIPVLVQGASMPRREDLPEKLQDLGLKHAIELSDARWGHDVTRLIEVLGPPPTSWWEAVRGIARRIQEPRAWVAVGALVVVGLGTITYAALREPDHALSPEPKQDDGGTMPSDLARTKIAFLSNQGGNCEIYVVNPDGTEQQQVTRNRATNLRPNWSPGGGRLVYASDQDGDLDIYLSNADGTGETRVTDLEGDEMGPDWSPSDVVVFSSTLTGSSEIRTIDLRSGQEPTQLTDNGAHNVAPAWSPDGSRIVFTSNVKGTFDLHVMRADGSAKMNLTADLFPGQSANEFDAEWSPDGSQIAFEARKRAGEFDIYVIDADGGSARNLTPQPSRDGAASWSPDGSMIVFGSDRLVADEDGRSGCSPDGSHRDLFVMDADDGSDQRKLLEINADNSSPAWGP